MRLSPLPLLILAILLAFFPIASSAQATHWQEIKIPPLHTFKAAQPTRIVLPNGFVIFLEEDHALPFIDGTLTIRGGSRDEPPAKSGLTEIYGRAWRTGGSRTKTGDEMDDFLEARAAKVETESDVDSTGMRFSCLKENFDEVFVIFRDLLLNPEFRVDKIGIAKRSVSAAIAHRNDNAMGVAFREATKLGYGQQSPYARLVEYSTVDAVSRQDLLEWHKKHVYANNIILGLVGDFDSKNMEAKLRQEFGAVSKGPAFHTPDIAIEPAKPGYYLVEKTDVNQSTVVMVQPGIRRDDSDYYAVQVFNEAFGGGFSSRLFTAIRSQKGLAYAVSGHIGEAWDHPGLVRLFVATKTESTVEATQALFAEIEGLAKNPLSDEEVRRAKDSLLNSFIFQVDSPQKVLRQRIIAAFYEYPLDLLEKYQSEIQKVTTADVNRVAVKYLRKDQLAVLVLGNPSGFDKPLSTLGSVTKLDISIPSRKSADLARNTATEGGDERIVGGRNSIRQ